MHSPLINRSGRYGEVQSTVFIVLLVSRDAREIRVIRIYYAYLNIMGESISYALAVSVFIL